jgi:hypothetical protein
MISMTAAIEQGTYQRFPIVAVAHRMTNKQFKKQNRRSDQEKNSLVLFKRAKRYEPANFDHHVS